MIDYYSILLRAVTAPGAGDARWRRGIYDRSRQMLASKMRALRPQPPLAQIAAEEVALEAAIERVESELSWTERGAAPARDQGDDDSLAARSEIEPSTLSLGLGRATLVMAAVVVAALGAGAYLFFSAAGQKSAPASTAAQAPATARASAPQAVARKIAKNGELAPGIDGGSSDPDQQYIFRRQPTFYRTLQPVGTIIVDKLQHFLYLIQPNNVALRYGIAVGSECANLAGLRHIASMAEWPAWQPPPEPLNRNPPPMPGGPGNPLGARILRLDDDTSRINGTNAPKTIGNSVSFGCIRLNNDDVTDLYNRVKLSTPVLVN
jgi:lipoprotein-anchoring transpeptidase ErfK/SrfK